jgi:hypothetical protein
MIDSTAHSLQSSSPDERARSYRVQQIVGDEMCALLDRIDARSAAEAERGIKAMALAPSIEVCRALLRGERVPWNTLRYLVAESYGLKRRRGDGRYGLDDFNDIPKTGRTKL